MSNKTRDTGNLTANGILSVDLANNRIGVGSTQPQQSVDVNGTIRATAFVNSDGSPVGAGYTANVETNTLRVIGVSTFNGNIDVRNSIITTGITNGNVVLQGNGTGDVEIAGTATITSSNPLTLGSNTQGIIVPGYSSLSNVNVSGVSTFQSHVNLGDNDNLYLGADQDLSIYHDGASGISWIQETGAGDLRLATNSSVAIQNTTGTAKTSAEFSPDGAAELYYNNSKKFETTGYGVTVTGTTESQQLVVSGISTFNDNVLFGVGVNNFNTIINAAGEIAIGTNAGTDGYYLKILAEDQDVIKIENTNNSIWGSEIRVLQDSSSPAANDKLLTLNIRGNDSGGNQTTYTDIISSIEDPTDGSESGKFTIQTRTNGTLTDRILINSTGVGIGTDGTDVVVGGATTTLIVNGDARVTGILTIGTASITLDGVNNQITAESVHDGSGSLRKIPQNSKSSSYTLIASDAGKHISITTGGVTIPASVLSVGDVVTIYNNSGSNQTITQGASTTLRQAGTSNTGNRTLGQFGLATILCVASDTFVVSGVGLS